jgi:serine-type D-Ala-D-Ala endopeptidase (penicillin-binding protein 7)
MTQSVSDILRIARGASILALTALICAGFVRPAAGSSGRVLATGRTKGTTTSQVKLPKAAGTSTTYSASSSRVRQARLARARASAGAREAAAVRTPRYRLDDQRGLVPDVRAEAAMIYNPSTGEVIWESGGFGQRSIASITKVMTTLCFLEDDPNLADEVIVARADVRGASTTYLRGLEKLRLYDVLHLALIASDNVAARTLARVSAGDPAVFVARMNQKASELGLTSTAFADPSGLDPRNVSSAYDLAKLIAYAGEDELIASVMRTSEYSFRTSRRALTIHNTNQLVRTGDLDVRGGKTGFIAQSGHCLATLLRLPELNQTFAVVVLGARSNAGRFWETRHLFNWLAGRASSLFQTHPPHDAPYDSPTPAIH